MEVSHKKRPIGWLIDRVIPAMTNPYIAGLISVYLDDCSMSPNEIHKKIFENCEKQSMDERKKLAQSARWLAIIYRDYGAEVLRLVLDIIGKVNEINPKETGA
jgi:hypothetical protein